MKRRQILINTKRNVWVESKFRVVLGMTWVGWLNYCLLQWFGLRIAYRTTDDGELKLVRLMFAWPMTRWYLSWRREVVVPSLVSLPVIALIAAFWLL